MRLVRSTSNKNLYITPTYTTNQSAGLPIMKVTGLGIVHQQRTKPRCANFAGFQSPDSIIGRAALAAPPKQPIRLTSSATEIFQRQPPFAFRANLVHAHRIAQRGRRYTQPKITGAAEAACGERNGFRRPRLPRRYREPNFQTAAPHRRHSTGPRPFSPRVASGKSSGGFLCAYRWSRQAHQRTYSRDTDIRSALHAAKLLRSHDIKSQ